MVVTHILVHNIIKMLFIVLTLKYIIVRRINQKDIFLTLPILNVSHMTLLKTEIYVQNNFLFTYPNRFKPNTPVKQLFKNEFHIFNLRVKFKHL